MADEFGHHATTGNWWDSSSRSRSSSSAAPANSSMGSFGWPADLSRSSMDSVSVSGSSVGYHDPTHKLQASDSTAGDGRALVDPNLHMMGLGLSSQAMDWNQALLRGEKSEGSFRSMLEENGSFHQQEQWRDSSADHSELKQINRGFSLDNPHQFSSEVDSSGVYGTPSTMLQGLLGSETQQHPHNSFEMNNSYQYPNYGINNTNNDLLASSWSNNKVPQFLRSSPPKQAAHSPLQFSNNAPFWNATMAEVRPSFFPTLPTTPTFDDLKPAKINMSETSTAVPKKSCETTSKRPRSDSPSPLPAFKVRKEKMGDRITALQQLVSPFGKTDTASVLSEAIEYIKFLHEQVNVLSTPYLKSGASIQHQQSCDKSSKEAEGAKQDLRSKGLCLVPVSSTFPVAHETTVDFWTPTFGGTFR